MAVLAPEFTKHPAQSAVTQPQHEDTGTAEEEEPYERDIDAYLRSMERAPGRLPAPDYLDGGHLITPATRAVLVGRLASAARSLALHSRTLHLAVSCLDRFLLSSSATTAGDYSAMSGVVVAASAALFAAAKYEELYWPEANWVLEKTCEGHPLLDACWDEDVFTKAQLTAAERVVLRAVGYDMSVPTAHTFLDHFLGRLKCLHVTDDDSAALLASYLAELSLLDYGMLGFRPSVVAASALLVARLTTAKRPWGSGALEAPRGTRRRSWRSARWRCTGCTGTAAALVTHRESTTNIARKSSTAWPPCFLSTTFSKPWKPMTMSPPCFLLDVSNKRAVRIGQLLCLLQSCIKLVFGGDHLSRKTAIMVS